jgi:hypothetical protein
MGVSGFVCPSLAATSLCLVLPRWKKKELGLNFANQKLSMTKISHHPPTFKEFLITKHLAKDRFVGSFPRV